MALLLYFAHAGVAVALVALCRLRRRWRARAVRVAALLGGLFAVVLFVTSGSDLSWRATTLGRPSAVVGLAIACSWLVAGVLDLRRGRWATAALVGVASSALVVAVSSEWVVPRLLFWSCSTLAIGALAAAAPGRAWAWVALATSDVAFSAAMIGQAVTEQTWRASSPLEGWPLYLVVVSVIVRSGVIPVIGIWRLASTTAAASLPLLVGGGFALLATGFSAQPWAGVALLVVALASGLWSVLGRTPRLTTVGAWPPAVMLAVALCAPGLAPAAGLAAIVAMTAACLWPPSPGIASAMRGFVFSFAPPSVAFSVVAVGAGIAFQRAASVDSARGAAPWTLVVTLLTLVLAMGVAIGARLARQVEWQTPTVSGVAATAALLVAWVVLGLNPEATPELASRSVLVDVGVAWPPVAALAVGVAAGTFAWLRSRRTAQEPSGDERFQIEASVEPRRLTRILSWTAVALALVSACAVSWITVQGLQRGFL